MKQTLIKVTLVFLAIGGVGLSVFYFVQKGYWGNIAVKKKTLPDIATTSEYRAIETMTNSLRTGEYESGRQILSGKLAQHPESGQLQMMLAWSYLEEATAKQDRSLVTRATEILARVPSKDTGSSAYYDIQGLIASLTGDYSTAQTFEEKALSVNPNNHWASLHYANVLVQKKDFERARSAYDTVMQSKSPELQARAHNGLALLALGKTPGALNEAIAHLEQGAALATHKSTRAMTLAQISMLKADQGDMDNARRYAEQSAVALPSSVFSNLAVAYSFFIAGDLESTRKSIDNAHLPKERLAFPFEWGSDNVGKFVTFMNEYVR